MKTSLTIKLVTLAGICAVGLPYALAQNEMETANSSKTGAKPKGKYGETGVELAHEISQEEAAKSYPPPHGGYPPAELTKGVGTGMATTIIESPYPPHHKFDTTGIKRGALILDTYTKHVFMKP